MKWKDPPSGSRGLLLGLMALSVLIRWPFLAVPMISDEGGYAYVARFWSEDYQLYRDIPFDRPQAIFLIYKLILFLFGGSVEAIRMAAALYNALTLGALYLMVRRAHSPEAAWLAGLVYALFSCSPGIEGFTANAELFTLLPLVVAAHLTWNRQWAWAGLASGIAFLVKPAALSGLLLAASWALWKTRSWKGSGQATLTFAVAPLASAAHGMAVGWEHYWASLVDRRLLLYSMVSLAPDQQWEALLGGVSQTLPVWLPAAVLAAWGGTKCGAATRAFGLFWLAASLAGMALGGNWFWHYFMQLIPPLAFLAGAIRLPRSLPLSLLWKGLTAVSLLLFVLQQAPFWLLSPRQISWRLYHRSGYLAAEEIARFVAARTGPGDPIYVAFSEAEIYYLARRRAAVPQLYWAEVYFSEEIYNRVVRALRNRTPAAVVWLRMPPDNWMSPTAFRDLLLAGYAERYRAEGISVYLRR